MAKKQKATVLAFRPKPQPAPPVADLSDDDRRERIRVAMRVVADTLAARVVEAIQRQQQR